MVLGWGGWVAELTPGKREKLSVGPSQKIRAVTWRDWNSESNWLAWSLLSLKKRAPARTASPCSCGGGRGRGETLARSAGGSTAHLQCKSQLQTVSKSTASRHTASLALTSRTRAGPIADTTRRSIIYIIERGCPLQTHDGFKQWHRRRCWFWLTWIVLPDLWWGSTKCVHGWFSTLPTITQEPGMYSKIRPRCEESAAWCFFFRYFSFLVELFSLLFHRNISFEAPEDERWRLSKVGDARANRTTKPSPQMKCMYVYKNCASQPSWRRSCQSGVAISRPPLLLNARCR